MKPGTLHRICAHPVAFAWSFLAVGINAIIFTNLAREYTWSVLLINPATVFWLTLLCAIIALICLIPAAMIYMPVAAVCARYNGAPFRLGDQVRVLAGKHRGKVATVDEISRGQGGWPLVRLALGEEYRPAFRDLFEECKLLRISHRPV